MSELLDWKLDFHNPSLGARFDKENGKITLVLTRATILMVGSLVFMPFLEHFLSANVPVFSWERYSILYLTSGWLVICFFLSFVKPVLKYVNLFANLVYFFFILILGIGNIIAPRNYVDDTVDAAALALILGAPIVLSLKTKYWLPFSAINVLINVIGNITEPGKAQNKIGYSIPSFICLGLGTYFEYMFEKRSKYLFFRQVLVDIEASKLHWAVARDASLLQNIFPKNLSDELERQMSTIKRQKDMTLSPSYTSRVSQQFFSSIPLISSISNIENEDDNDNDDYNNNNDYDESNNNNLIKSTQFNTDLNASLASMPSDEEMIRIGIIKSESEPVSMRKKVEQEVELLPRTLTGNFLRQKEELQKQLTVLIPPTPKTFPPSVIFAIPPVITTPSVSCSSLSPPSSATYSHENVIISSGTALQTPIQAEVHTFLSGAQHIDGSCIALSHSYPSVSIIFADIVGFTTMSSSISPQDLVKLLNEMFTKFDEIIDYHHLEKIRTVGDAYLCVGNMTIPLENHMEEAIAAGLKMITAVATVRDSMHLRVGIATGSIIAGVTGLTKWNYDIFGQSVAEACHQETLAPPDHVAVTHTIYEQCKNKFNFVVEPNSGLFLVPGSRDEILPAELSSFHQSEDCDIFSFLDLPRNRDPLFHAVNNIAHNEIMENFIPNISEDMDLSFNFEEQFGYTREDVEREASLLTVKTSLFPFRNLSFRVEYQIALVDMVHDFTKKQCILFGIGLLFFMVSFILVSPSIVLPTVIIIGCAALVFFAYTWYAKHYDYHPLAGYVALAVVSTGISSFVAICVIDSNETNMFCTLVALLFLVGFYRAPPLPLIVMTTLLSIPVAVLGIVGAEFEEKRARYIVSGLVIIAVTAATQIILQISFKEQFLLQKKIKYDIYNERITQKRAKMLLHNIIPEEIIPRLGLQPTQAIVDHYENATLMFINLTNLAELTENLDPSSTFRIYNDIFVQFDNATSLFGLEKIKTINTVYMVACGLPKHIPDHAEQAVMLAIELYKISRLFSSPLLSSRLTMRIGIASGPAVAGIIGKKKYSYDCWSDTTNTASRMESNSRDGHVQLTPFSFSQILKYKQYFVKRENLWIKGKGNMDTFILNMAKIVKC